MPIMFKCLPHPIRGILSILLYTLNTIILTVPLILLSFLKFIISSAIFISSVMSWGVIIITKLL